jgi:dolichol-phosphate mannosyltransferase
VIGTSLGRFLLVGGSGVVVNSCALAALHQGVGVPLLIASPLAVELSIIHNFVWNDRWTFRHRARSRTQMQRFARFNLVSLIGLLITTGITLLLVEQLGIQYLISNLCGVALATLCNFSANTHWTWQTREA